MSETPETMRERLLAAALGHVPFDGWSEATFQAACKDAGVAPALARAVLPRGAVDLARAYHTAGDAAMVDRLQVANLGAMRFRDRIAAAVRYRLEVADREAVRRGTALFALPQHAAEGAKAIWGTADLIWETLGDRSDDINWYTKRMTLSGVYASTVLFWLGDETPGAEATWAFLDRRIEDVMRIETAKAKVKDGPVLSKLFAGPMWLMGKVHAPKPLPEGMPGVLNRGDRT
ncbi:MAG: COQ9 family protein [Rhodobacteraceae bacterium]|nr:COQ9 family protein [Paracoccaceae bacterium]